MQSAQIINLASEQAASALLSKRFLALFPQRFGSVFRSLKSDSWRSMSQFHFLSDAEILAALATKSNYFRACLPELKTTFVVGTLSVADNLSNGKGFLSWLNELRASGFRPNLYREAGSDSIQIYISFTELISTNDAVALITELFPLANFSFHCTERPFVLPLQKGFCWLNDNLSVKVARDDTSLDSAIAMFLHDMESTAVSPQLLFKLEKKVRPEIQVEESSVIHIHIEVGDIQQENEPADILELPHTELVSEGNVAYSELPNQTESIDEIPCNGSQQLLLFPVETQLIQLELPKERPKRANRARSNLPDGSLISDFQDAKLFTSHTTDAKGVLKITKEVNND